MIKKNPPVERSKLKNIGLFVDEEELTKESTKTNLIKITEIKLPEKQPRRYFDSSAMEQLKASIVQDGILQPLLVRPIERGYELIAGERRYRVALEIGLKEVPVYIRELDDEQVQQFALTENLQREDLNPIEETHAILDLLALKLKISREKVISLLNQIANKERGFTDNVIRKNDIDLIESLFQGLGRFTLESFRTNRLPLLNLPPEILTELSQGTIAYTKARAIAKVKDEEQRKELLKEAIREELSLSQIKEKIALIKEEKKVEVKDTPQNRVKNLSKQLNEAKLWQSEPKKWKKVQSYLDKIEALLKSEES